jgi:hypothetical protein
MEQKLLFWNIFEISSASQQLNGVMLRGRIRKFGLENGINILVENADDQENTVRLATLNDQDAEQIKSFVGSIVFDAAIELVVTSIANPVLSKLKVNDESRYTL